MLYYPETTPKTMREMILYPDAAFSISEIYRGNHILLSTDPMELAGAAKRRSRD